MPGLYRSAYEHDSCGFGLIAQIDDVPTHGLVLDALSALNRLGHRGGVDADGRSGDGCGVLLRFPDRFMRALERVQQVNRRCHAIIVGGDQVSYGRAPVGAPNWRDSMLAEVRLDPARTHFAGRLPTDLYRRVLQVSGVHVHLTYPFVLSWSLLEAMASGCLVIGSRTAPVEEVVRDGENGILVDFFDTEALAERICEALEGGGRRAALRDAARTEIRQRYTVEQGVTGYGLLAGVGVAGLQAAASVCEAGGKSALVDAS